MNRGIIVFIIAVLTFLLFKNKAKASNNSDDSSSGGGGIGNYPIINPQNPTVILPPHQIGGPGAGVSRQNNRPAGGPGAGVARKSR